MLVLYNDDGTEALRTPPVKEVSSSGFNQQSNTYTFVTKTRDVWIHLQNFLNARNYTQTNTQATNVNGKLVGDYTCWVLDTLTNLKFKAKIEMSTSSERFWNRDGWQSNGRNFQLTVTEVE